MIDIHTHILPAVDDGPKAMADAVEMVRRAVLDGARTMVATPHAKDVCEHYPNGAIRGVCDALRAELTQAGLEVEVLLAMENPLATDLRQQLSVGLQLPYPGGRYVLVELPYISYPPYADEVLFQLQLAGLTPVLAHPERTVLFQRHPSRLAALVSRDVLVQVTAGGLLGHFGPECRSAIEEFLRMGIVHAIASDSHAPVGDRGPGLRRAVEAAARVVGPERAEALVTAMPQAIVRGAPLPELPPVRSPKRRWILG
ncbi:MAG: phosphotransferase [Chloroflexi bacterium]|nr:phosphotransferase [Chloroflexota bacterium]